MRKQWTIGAKLGASFGCLVALVVLLGAASLRMSGQLSNELEKAVNVVARMQLFAGQAATASANMEAYERASAFAVVLQQTDKATASRREYDAAEQVLLESVKGLGKIAADSDAQREIRKFEEKALALHKTHSEFHSLLGSGQIDVALKLFDDRLAPGLRETNTTAKALVAQQEKHLKVMAAEAESQKATTWWLLVALCVITVPVGVVTAFVIRKATSTLRSLSSQISNAAREVAEASRQISEASRSVAEGASTQAGSLEETSASGQELSSITQKNAEQSRSAAQVMAEVDARVQDANTTLEQMVASMREISGSSEKIARIIKVIDEISFQTNILALNAAVEAARAGEAGMGFAVVADEVRRLAQRCAQAAKDTAALIEESITTSSEGTRKIERMSTSIGSITESATRVKQIVDELNHSSQEQAQGIELITSALTELEAVTQQAAASAEQSASISESMSSQAQVMNRVVTQLVDLVGDSRETAKV
ncbi:MAG TPA: methyl-accepting chemotaxis protein [Bryobacteraceae bacterium]|nr:methyl-accepting chemotaxis protein [Bryobacteraceae bacterium]